MNDAGRTIACPYCSTRYFLPHALMGGGGARVRCPQCTRTFAVSAEGLEAALDETHMPGDAAAPGEAAAPAPGPPASTDVPHAPGPHAAAAATAGDAAPDRLAAQLLDAMAVGRGEAIRSAAEEGRLFAAFGPELMKAYDAYRREVGRDADPAPFRHAMRERWGIEILPADPAE
jgi:predicted Zn finger-like uncharacterized protein